MTNVRSQSERPISIVIAGEAGAGIKSIELVLTQAFHLAGYHVFASKEYMSRVRGGSNSTLIRVGGNEVRAWSNRIDFCIPFGDPALLHLENHLGAKTIILGDKESITSDRQLIDANLMKIANEAGKNLCQYRCGWHTLGNLWAGSGNSQTSSERSVFAKACRSVE